MSKDRFLIKDEKPYFLLRNAYAKALEKEGLLYKKDLNDTITIREEKSPTKHTIFIKNLDCENTTQTVTEVWVFDLEKEQRGYKTSGKTTECALLVFIQGENQDKILILLPELKTSLQTNDTLSNCETKFKDSINRLYLLLLATNDRETSENDFKNTKIAFKGIVFYQNDKINEDKETESELFRIKTAENSKGFANVSTILNENDKINIEFVKTTAQQTFLLKNLIF